VPESSCKHCSRPAAIKKIWLELVEFLNTSMNLFLDLLFIIITYCYLYVLMYCISSDPKILKTQFKTEVEVKSEERKTGVAKVNPTLYKKLIIEDLTSTGMHLLIVIHT